MKHLLELSGENIELAKYEVLSIANIKNYKLILFLHKDRKSNKATEMTCDEVNKKLKLPKFYIYHLAKIQQFYLEKLKIPKNKFRFKELTPEERAFYNKIHFDVELYFDTLNGFKEVSGLHYRSDFDLKAHQKGSGERLDVNVNGKPVICNILETSFGVDRNIWALVDIFFKEEKERTLFTFPPKLAPIDVAVFPLVNKDGLPEKAREIYTMLKEDFETFYDQSGSVGRLYRRQDEVGTRACITVDHQTLKNNTVTLRNHTSMRQIRVKIANLNQVIRRFLEGEDLSKLGKFIN